MFCISYMFHPKSGKIEKGLCKLTLVAKWRVNVGAQYVDDYSKIVILDNDYIFG